MISCYTNCVLICVVFRLTGGWWISWTWLCWSCVKEDLVAAVILGTLD